MTNYLIIGLILYQIFAFEDVKNDMGHDLKLHNYIMGYILTVLLWPILTIIIIYNDYFRKKT